MTEEALLTVVGPGAIAAAVAAEKEATGAQSAAYNDSLYHTDAISIEGQRRKHQR
jgi:hypothetical protein